MAQFRQLLAASTCAILLTVAPGQSQIPIDSVPKITSAALGVANPNSQIVIQTEYTDRQGPGLHVWFSAGFYDPLIVDRGAGGGYYEFGVFPETASQLQRWVTRVWSFDFSRVNTTIVVN